MSAFGGKADIERTRLVSIASGDLSFRRSATAAPCDQVSQFQESASYEVAGVCFWHKADIPQGKNRIPLEPCRSTKLTASSLNSQTASAARSSERINLRMRRRITADIQRSQLGFTLSMTAMAFSIRRVAP